MQANLKCSQAVCEVQVQGKSKKLRPIYDDNGQEDGHMLSCSVEQLRDAGKTEVLSPKQAAKLLKQGAASWLMLVQKDQYGMDQGTTCASMVAGQEEGLVAPEVVDKIKDEFKDVFEPVDACPPARGGVDHVIRLQQGSSPSFMRPFRMSKHEEEECMKQVQDALGKGLIEPSCSPYGAPLLFVSKKMGA